MKKKLTAASASEPTPYCLGRVARLRVEAQLGLRSVLMHHVDQLLKQYEVAWNRPDACPDQDAIEPLPPELASHNRLRSFTEIGETHLHTVADTSQFLFRGLES